MFVEKVATSRDYRVRPSLSTGSGRADLEQVSVGIAKETAHLPRVLKWGCQELGSSRLQRRVGRPANPAVVISRLTLVGSGGAVKITSGLSVVGLPPMTGRSHMPRNRGTTEVPAHSHMHVDPRGFAPLAG